MIINTIYSVPSKKHATQYFTVPAATAAEPGCNYWCLPWMLCHCWLGERKSIQPVKIEWRCVGTITILSADSCKLFPHGPADVTAIPSTVASLWSTWFTFQAPAKARLASLSGKTACHAIFNPSPLRVIGKHRETDRFICDNARLLCL